MRNPSSSAVKQWLRKEPTPYSLKVETEGGEERTYKLPSKRGPGASDARWAETEIALRSMRAVKVEALNRQGEVLRISPTGWGVLCDVTSTEPSDPESEGEGDGSDIGIPPGLDPDTRRELAIDRFAGLRLTSERKDFALAIDRQGHRMVEAFRAGAEAASGQQDKLVELVSILTNNLSQAIVNLHNISVQLAEARANSGGDDEDKTSLLHGANGQQIAGLLAAVLAKGVLTGDDDKPNGKARAKE
jgi:hypothetical protein